ncbi:hypothetical protein M422DRAFT_275559 [Sphaerobolus stellatus SS14]|uniref:Uncharacterized protein n=1 Tax=Sphaerobolus stellatus (strain SS14) TaxID=990650 RepID=A0A0C9U3T3_SPHS4|nr:hypothetical protein M422DRAFT_275559 [Sphaerobolus stellatus SS14]
MAIIPSRTEAADLYDGVQMVHFNDAKEHLSSFLAALYNTCMVPIVKHRRDTASNAEGILLLATKYPVDHLRSLRRKFCYETHDTGGGLVIWEDGVYKAK